MKKNLFLLLLASVCFLGIQRPNLEARQHSTGEKIDDALNYTKDKIDKAKDKVKDGFGKAKDKTKDGIDKAKDGLDKIKKKR